MACFRNSSRFCVRAQDKLCQLLINNKTQINNNYKTSNNCNLIINQNRKLITSIKTSSATESKSSSSSSSSTTTPLSSPKSSSSLNTDEIIYVNTKNLNNFYYTHNKNNNKLCNNHLNNYQSKRNYESTSNNKLLSKSTSETAVVASLSCNLPTISSPSILSIRNYSSKSKPSNKSYTSSSSKFSSSLKIPSSQLNFYNHPCTRRAYSSVHHTQQPGPIREIQVDPYILLEDDLKYFYEDIRKLIVHSTTQPQLETIASYYFDGQGKSLRPMLTLLMARAVNYHMNKESSSLVSRQRKIAIFSEMVHSASLVHDDVIDQSDFRRGKPSVNALWNHRKVSMAGDFILSIASVMIARLKSDEVTIILSQILTDLVQGEFMQLGSKETENERFAHYLTKTYRKTASLIANTLKSVAVLAGADDSLSELAFQYGRNVGLAFQLVDDLLDFVSSTEAMGKPTVVDLKLGLATAPVLFACEKYPELNPMIMRRFQEPGDVERAFELVHKSQGLEQTRFLARKHCIEAIRLAQEMTESPYQKGLIVVSDLVINRMK